MEKSERTLKKDYLIGNIAKWKSQNKQYIKEVQTFFDKTSNVKDEELQYSIIVQMLKCDEILTRLSEKMFMEYYNQGYNKAKIEK